MNPGVPNPGAEAVADGLTGSSAGAESPETAQGKSAGNAWAAVEALAALLEPEAFDPEQPADETWREVTQQRALGHAAKVITASDYRRVVEDDDTIERVAIAMAEADGYSWECSDGYRRLARAVVRALREET
jgi:hypothetical protein